MGIIKILIIVTNVSMYTSGKYSTGLWLSELTHMYDAAKVRGYDITIASPNGGDTPVDPESLKFFTLDRMSKKYWNNKTFREELKKTRSLKEVENENYDVVYVTGGHGTMYDFPDNPVLQNIIAKQYEENKMVAAICHGVSSLINVKTKDGNYLIKNKKITGYNWFEEGLAGRKKEVPFNLEDTLKKRGSRYQKALIPMTSYVVVDKNLITGQNPFSSKKIAKVVVHELEKKSGKSSMKPSVSL
ncbi:type 1 glutamine amidotransferase domain-containing protein [Chryseobacterium sp. T16E-39]|uniref:type 1 glutamine amidotransferase domain-containing protein n=1 Tax=Chryseobacterium sp. T16E-39 TaxID=2015076 RepID=UPI000B5B3FD9|nr:type 1 glutamine amidotransferase domain-containing protein [Chryseobacterium sp. T16E-39]ASK29672.1 type 1 glutamine amidotransferase domain-containing protein [Chryseobacterium sp. T16E-39]